MVRGWLERGVWCKAFAGASLGCALLAAGERVASAQTGVTIAVAPARAATEGRTLVRNAPKPAALAQAAQVKISSVHPELVKVDAVNPGQAKPQVSLSSGVATVSVKQGEQLVVRAPEAEPPSATLAPKTKALLASTVIVGVSDAAAGTTARQLRPFLLAEVSPLRWDAKAATYLTTVIVGLDPSQEDSTAAPVKLDPPIVFQLTGENVAEFKPNQVAVAMAGPDGYQRIVVSSRGFGGLVKVSAHSRAGDGSFNASVDPGPAFFDLGQSEATIDGLGLGKTTISVRQRAANGDLLLASTALHCELKTTAGQLSPPYVDIPVGRSDGQTSLVSSAWGRAQISEASSLSPAAHAVTVSFAFPWLKVLLGLLGAAAAGGVRVLMAKPAKGTWLSIFLGCLASGIVIDILVALGAPLAPAWLLGVIRSELAWFAIGLVAGFPGAATLEWLGTKIFGMGKPESSQT